MNTKRNSAAGVRGNRPQRDQIEWQPLALEALIADDHRVRSVWAYVDALDLTLLYEQIRAVEGSAGRNAVDPRILLALWMFATIEGVSSARHLARLCERDLPYLWLCGGVGVNHHLLSDFRALQTDSLDQLLIDTISTLLHQNIVTLETVAQDGMRVRASAGRLWTPVGTRPPIRSDDCAKSSRPSMTPPARSVVMRLDGSRSS